MVKYLQNVRTAVTFSTGGSYKFFREIYYEQKRIYTDLIHLGCLFQVNWLSIAGYYGKDTKAIAHWMIDNGYVDFMGTDLHNMHHAVAITEYLNSKDYQKVIRKLNLKNELL